MARIVFKCGHSERTRGPKGFQKESQEVCIRCWVAKNQTKAVDSKTITTEEIWYDGDEGEEIWDPTEDEALMEHEELAEKENPD